jgi:hypothetical protein
VSGQPVSGAEVVLDNGASYLTDTSGVARLLPGLPNTQHLLIRKLGFAPLDVTSNPSIDQQGRIVHLQSAVSVLQTVNVTAERDRMRTEFALRVRTGIGHYITEADIKRQKPGCFLDLLKKMPELRVKKSGGCSGSVSAFRGAGTILGDPAASGCVRLVVDGGSISGYDAVNTDDIVGVEVYDETAAPARYGTQCAVVAVWTKEAGTID